MMDRYRIRPCRLAEGFVIQQRMNDDDHYGPVYRGSSVLVAKTYIEAQGHLSQLQTRNIGVNHD